MKYFSTRLLILSCILSVLIACERQTYQQLSGATMGTQYRIVYKPNDVDTENLHDLVEQELLLINQQMSTYIADSELSLLNSKTSQSCESVSPALLKVLLEAKRIFELSSGSFDPTLGPLIELWGFDKTDTNDQIPSESAINQAKQKLAFKATQLDTNNSCVTKGLANTEINLSAIAKGYAVDQLAAILKDQFSITDYLVDIGGEVKVAGNSPRGSDWNIAIEAPVAGSRQAQRVISPNGQAVATSGDYRNYFEKDNVRYSHTIDPVSGYPITHKLASVTVIHSSTMTADALATAFMVMGDRAALELANQQNIAIFMVVKSDDGFSEVFNAAFEPYINPSFQPNSN